jgi:hypothetical protein
MVIEGQLDTMMMRDLQLKIACLERDINEIKIALINITNEEERREKEQKIETTKQRIETTEQLILRLFPREQMQVAPQGILSIIIVSLTLPPLSQLNTYSSSSSRECNRKDPTMSCFQFHKLRRTSCSAIAFQNSSLQSYVCGCRFESLRVRST